MQVARKIAPCNRTLSIEEVTEEVTCGDTVSIPGEERNYSDEIDHKCVENEVGTLKMKHV